MPLQWLPELAEGDSRVAFAVEHLLAEGDPVVTDRLLHVATNAALRRAVAAALPRAAATLASIFKRELEAKDDSRQKLAAIGIALPPAESGSARWQRYAGHLGVAP